MFVLGLLVFSLLCDLRQAAGMQRGGWRALEEEQRQSRLEARENTRRIVEGQKEQIHQMRLLHDPDYRAEDLVRQRKKKEYDDEQQKRQERWDREERDRLHAQFNGTSEATTWAREHPWLMRVCDVAVAGSVVGAEVVMFKFRVITLPLCLFTWGAPFLGPAGLGTVYYMWRTET